jgi:hypothetical protein
MRNSFAHVRPGGDYPDMPNLCKTSRALSLSVGALAIFGIGTAKAPAGPGDGAGSVRAVLLREIESQATISVAPHVTLDFSDGGANNVTLNTSDHPDVAQMISKTSVVTVAPGMAHVSVANFGHCPKSTSMVAIHCDPIPVYSVTINVGSAP